MTEATIICSICKIATKFIESLAVSFVDGNHLVRNNAAIANFDIILEQWNGADQ